MKNFIAVLTTGDVQQTISRYSDFVLAFGMILRWRTGMYLRYRALREEATASRGKLAADRGAA